MDSSQATQFGGQKYREIWIPPRVSITRKNTIEYMNADVRQNVKRGNVNLSEAVGNAKVQNETDVSLNSLKVDVDELTKAISSSGLIKYKSFSRNARSKCWLHETGMHDISECNRFIQLTNAEKVRRYKACFQCFENRSRFPLLFIKN